MKKIILAIALMGAATAQAAQKFPPQWNQLAELQHSFLYYDANHTLRIGNVITTWTRMVMKEPTPVAILGHGAPKAYKDAAFSEMRSHALFHCGKGTVSISSFFLVVNGKAVTLKGLSLSNGDNLPVADNFAYKVPYDYLCKNEKPYVAN